MTRTCTILVFATAALARGQPMNMPQIAQALGVSCEYCHSAPSGSDQAEPKKEIARAMMAMTRDLNAKVQQATGKPANETTRVECMTCHRGVAIPKPLATIIVQTLGEKGGAAAAQQYRDLRKQYYGRAAYDFSEDSLLEIAQRVVEARPNDAIALLRMNLDFNPQSAKSYALIGFAYTRKLDSAAAITALEKSVELDPANGIARGLLDQLQEDRRRKQQQ